jgi:hypothetical protein
MFLDTIECLSIKEPLSVPRLGSVFWAQSYASARADNDSNPNFGAFLSQPWTTHYAVPLHGGLALEIKLAQPLRSNEGFESVRMCVDYIMSMVRSSYTCDWNQQAKIDDLSIPGPLITALKELLMLWQGEDLVIHYSLLPGEWDPLSISAQFSYCRKLPENADEALRLIAGRLTEAMA